ncbi:MAG: S41 family peptidase [Longimicrobiales bacterium]
MKIKRTIMTPMVVALLALATGGWLLQRGVEPGRNVYANSRVFNEVMRYVSEGFVDQKDDSELYRMAIDGMLEQLGDPHTGFMPAKEYEDLRITTQGEYGGLGISISKRAGWITVINPLPGTPGERAGLRAGDQIIEVNGETTKSWTEEQAVAKLRGPKGTAVDLKIARFGDAIPFKIVRDAIHLKSVPTDYMLEKDIGYVELTVFSESSTDELRAALQRLRGQGARAVILDMRGNSGGLLDQGVAVSDLFLDRGQLVVETKGRVESQNHKIQAVDPDEYPGMPLVVLVGERSASATEIVAGALQDHDRALVLGRTTYGKGSVQTVFKLSDNNWLKLTTAKWYTPSGRSIQRPFGDDHPVEAIVDPTADPTASSTHDATTDRPTYKTDGGRVVFGGGGIRPDVVVMPDTLTLAERVFVQVALDNENQAKYREAQFAYGVRFNKEHPDIKPGFEVTQAMRDEFYAELKQAGLDVDRAAYDDARRWVDIQLGREITYSRWGVAENRKRENRSDPQVRIATELLRKAKDPKSLFAAATTYESNTKTAGAARGGSDR